MVKSIFSNICDRPSCHSCHFRKQYRVSDFTIWDCFNVGRFSKELDNDKGATRVLEFNLRLFEKLESAIFINKPFYHYIYNENSISASHNEANHEFVIRCFEKIKEFIDTSDNKEMLKPWFDNRLLYVIVTTAISGYFNPTNTESYEDKKRKYAVYLEKPIVKEALKTKNTVGIGKQRKIVLFFIKHRMYWIVNMMGKMRKWQKEHR